MPIPNAINGRIRAWMDAFKESHPSCPVSPISIYQSLFSLFHELKGSIHLNASPEVQALGPIVIKCDEILKCLAYDEHELTSAANLKLYALASKLESFDELASFLENHFEDAVKIASQAPDAARFQVPWDGLSKARAMSCTRHGYRFFEAHSEAELHALPEHDQKLLRKLAAVGGLAIARALNPVAKSPTELVLKIKQIIAYPPKAPSPATPWKEI